MRKRIISTNGHTRSYNLATRTYTSILFLSYGLILLFLSPVLSLWLDELLQVTGVRDLTFSELMKYVPLNLGGVPLGYIVQSLSVKLFGYSPSSARLPSVMFSLLACYGILRLSSHLPIKRPLLAVIIFACFPLQLRYALEARPYAQALCFSIWSTVAFFALLSRPVWSRAALYFLCIVAGLYTQPFTLFVPCMHTLWLLLRRKDVNWRACILWTFSAILLASLSFLPWYLYASPLWRQGLQLEHYELSMKSVLLIIKELVGSGYIGSSLTLIIAGFGIAALGPRERSFWSLYIILPICLAVIADVAFGYFLAIRQMIFVLAPLSLLAALGLEEINGRYGRLSIFISATFFLTLITANIFFFQRKREDWEAAARALVTELKQHGCVEFVPANSAVFYRFFQPDLLRKQCAIDRNPLGDVAVAVSPYEPKESYEVVKKRLHLNVTPSRTLDFHGPRIDIYESLH